MIKKTDVLIIGGSAAGMVAAVSGKNSWPDKNFTLVKKQKDVFVPCGIPYIFGTLESSEKDLIPILLSEPGQNSHQMPMKVIPSSPVIRSSTENSPAMIRIVSIMSERMVGKRISGSSLDSSRSISWLRVGGL